MANFWCRAASAALCVALSTNMMEVSAIDTSQDPFESSTIEGGQQEPDNSSTLTTQPESDKTELCKHHNHDENCGYTEDNPRCSFICPICPVEEQIDAVLELMEQQKEQETDLNEDDKLDLLKQAAKAKKAFDDLEEEEKEQIDPDKIEEFLEFVDSLEIQTPDNADGQEQPDSPSTPANPPQIDTEAPDRPQTNLDNTQNQTQTGDTATSSEFVEDPDTPTVSNGSGQNQTVPSSTTSQPSKSDNPQPDNQETDVDSLKPSEEDKPNLSNEEEPNPIEEDNENNTSFDSVDTSNIQALSEETDTNPITGMKIVTAEIWAEGKENQSLLKESSPSEPSLEETSFSIDFSKQFTLHLVVDSELNLPNKKVEITVPDGLTVVEYPIPDRGGMAESVTPENIDQLQSENNYGEYRPTNGTITYSLKATAQQNSFNIVLAPDLVLWNRRAKQKLTDSLKIKVYTANAEGTDQVFQTISATPTITGKYNSTSSDTRAIQTGPRLSSVGVKNGVPTAANEPFALRQIWLNPDKDYIDMPQFFKKLEITIALPYYKKNNQNVYAQFDHITYDPAGQSTRLNLLNPENYKDAKGDYKDSFTFKTEPNDTQHTVKLIWENLYLEYGQEYFTPYFTWGNKCEATLEKSVTWSNSSIFSTGNVAPTCYQYEKPPASGSSAAVCGLITWQDGTTWYPWNHKFASLNFTPHSNESMSVVGGSLPPIYNAFGSDPSIVYCLGQFQVVNHGGDKSAPKTVKFSYTNTNEIGVTAQKIPATSGNLVTVQYQTTKTGDDTWTSYSTPLTAQDGFVTFTAQMANLAKDEYFTKIKADVGSYERDYVGYVASRSTDPTSGCGTTFGKLLTAETSTYSGFATMKMHDISSDQNNIKSGTFAVTITNETTGTYGDNKPKGEIPLAMEQAYKQGTLERKPILSKTTATAGDTITFNGLLSSSAFPYSTNNIATDPEIYIHLPEKITVSNLKLYQEVGRVADKVFLFDSVIETNATPTRTEISSETYTLTALTPAEAAANTAAKTGYKLYKITFEKATTPVKVGWFTNTLGQYQIGISFDMEIAKDADAMTLDMRDCVRFKSKSLTSTSNDGTLAQYQVMGKQYSINGNNYTVTDNGVRYSTFNVNATGTKLSVVAARLGLTFSFGARMTDKGSKAEFDPEKYSNFDINKHTVYLKDADHVVDMLFTLKNETGREFSKEDAHAFYYFIPIPKKGDFWDSHMQEQPFEFDMNLTREPDLNGTSAHNIQVTYATDIDSNAKAGDPTHYATVTNNYKAKEELLIGCETEEEKAAKWKEVKMIRIAAKPEINSISEKAELRVNMRLEPTFNENADLVGSEINFGPCGVSPYSVGNTSNRGHNPLPRIQVEFQTGKIAGKIFIDKDFDGQYKEGVDELYTGEVKIEANHSNGNDSCSEGENAHKTTAKEGKFEFTGRRADTYHVIVHNPGSTDANDPNSLRFSIPESRGKFSLGEEGKTATASIILDMNKNPNDLAAAQPLSIGFQQPHTVTFKVDHGTVGNKTDATQSKIWHNEVFTEIPIVIADEGYRFTGNWTDESNKIYTSDQLKEVKVSNDMNFTAEVKKLYFLTYDLNGGTGASAPQSTLHIEGEMVKPEYTNTHQLKKGDKTIFVGWSTEQILGPLTEDATQDDIGKIITSDEHRMPAYDVTLYAVYAVDNNDNGKPDYRDGAVHIRYHGNNNVRTDIICPHHHVVGETVSLSTNGTVAGKSVKHGASASNAAHESSSHSFTYEPNIFVGWSTSPILGQVIKTYAEFATLQDSIKTEVTLLEKPGADGSQEDAKDTSKYADADGNTNVYAVWAADRNNNKIADYLEERKLTYDGNAQQEGRVDHLPPEVTQTTDHTPLLPKDLVTLTGEPTHTDVGNKKVIFIGWTENKTNSIFSRADTAPITVTEVTMNNAGKTVYAAWAYDEDDDNEADVLETYTLTYDLNEGTGTIPETQTNIQKNTLITLSDQKNFTRNPNEIFIGWSKDFHTNALPAEQDVEKVKANLFRPGSKYHIGAEDVTLHAVWAVDVNNNGIPDYSEEHVHIRYHDNTKDHNDIICPHSHVTGEMIKFSNDGQVSGRIVEHEQAADEATSLVTNHSLTYKPNIFIGWSTSSSILGKIIETNAEYESLRNSIVTEITMSAKNTNAISKKGSRDISPSYDEEGNLHVYAVWAADDNNNHVADYLEERKLIYDSNAQQGGNVANMPEAITTTNNKPLISGDTVTLADTPTPTHSKVDGKTVLFLGWTAAQTNKIYDRTDTAPTTINEVTFADSDVTVYAAWGYDEDNDRTADVLETYTLAYNLNDGTGTIPATVANIAKNTTITLSDLKDFTRNTNEVFVGWSRERHKNALSAEEKEEVSRFLLLPGKVCEIGAQNVTLYAVWAVDVNNNGIPDYGEDHVHIRYHANTTDHMDIICPHSHVAGETVQLSNDGQVSGRAVKHDQPAADADGKVKNHTFTYGTNVLIGWSTTSILDKVIKTKADYEELKNNIVTEIALPSKSEESISEEDAKGNSPTVDSNGNIHVYAVWATDRNGNKKADCLEEYKLIYDGNALQGDSVTGVPDEVSQTSDGNPLLSGDTITLTGTPVYSDTRNKKVMFIGWTETKSPSIFSRADVAPTTVTQVILNNADMTVYAAWGYDDDNDGTADVLETYTLTYDLNGGKGTAPEKVLGIPKNTEISLPNEKNFTRNSNEIFVGWSETKRVAALTADEKEEKVNQFLLLPGTKYRMGPEDVTLYAVWALDANSDGIPDHQAVYTVTYNLNGGTGASGVSYAKKQVKPGDTVTVKAAPTRSGYTFTGWFDGEKNYQPGEKITVLNADLALTAQWKKNTDSTVLTNVTTPINPNTPTNTTLSNRPTNTTTSNNPTNTSTPNKADKSKNDPPQTGNETNLVLWLTILGISFMGLIVGWLGIKRNFGAN
ncbi:InlB B-repeat-containing protein [Allobaculum sp. JKK-2023]|uniref:InlB B-repeat-containing protein n=1 Tax=Allobaculum sp. JKK-2023 TaxID=3108943 RepID=UPI002B056C0C|nr:InlB B-repeat-containing protein [Allobaculum sp. JKK-2023]